MQLSNLLTKPKHDSGVWYTVVDPATGNETNFRILVSGMDSKIYRTETRALASRMVAGEELDPDLEQAKIIAKLVREWHGLIDDDGKDVAFTPEAAESLLSNSPFLCDQIDRFVSNRANFM